MAFDRLDHPFFFTLDPVLDEHAHARIGVGPLLEPERPREGAHAAPWPDRAQILHDEPILGLRADRESSRRAAAAVRFVWLALASSAGQQLVDTSRGVPAGGLPRLGHGFNHYSLRILALPTDNGRTDLTQPMLNFKDPC